MGRANSEARAEWEGRLAASFDTGGAGEGGGEGVGGGGGEIGAGATPKPTVAAGPAMLIKLPPPPASPREAISDDARCVFRVPGMAARCRAHKCFKNKHEYSHRTHAL